MNRCLATLLMLLALVVAPNPHALSAEVHDRGPCDLIAGVMGPRDFDTTASRTFGRTASASDEVTSEGVRAPQVTIPFSRTPRAARGVTSGANVTEETIQHAMKDAPFRTDQGAVSLPAVRRYVDMLAEGKTPPPIKVDNGVIVEGNHRYVAGRVFGQEPAVTPGVRPTHKTGPGLSWDKMKVDPTDWGNK